MRTLQLTSSRTFPVPVGQAYDAVQTAPLPVLFARRYGAIPPIRSVRDQDGVWGTVGQTRTIVLADGGTMREELTSADRPDGFGYWISDISGPMKPLVAGVEGRWSFEPAGTGVRVTWSWTVHPAGRTGSLAMPVFARLWAGYARQGLEEIEKILVA